MQGALSFFVSSTVYRQLAEWRAVIERLAGFQRAVEAGRAVAVTPPAIEVRPAEGKSAGAGRTKARGLTVEDCYFEDVMSPVAFVGVDEARVQFNTIVRPGKWALRILQENQNTKFVPCRKGTFRDNIIVFQSGSLGEAVNIGPGTEPASFIFAQNLWFCEDKPAETQRRIRLPVKEEAGQYGTDPKLDPATGRSTLPNGTAGIRAEKPSR